MRFDALGRRALLKQAGLACCGLSLPSLFTWRKAAVGATGGRSFGRARACIVLWMTGGPPQHETWDPKPDAPAEIRGPFGSIATPLAGVRVGEWMPRTAALVDRLCVLRAVHTDNPSHPGSSYEMLTGTLHARGKGRDDIVDSRSDFPTYSSIVKRFRPAVAGMPGAVVLPQPIFNVPFYPGQHGGFLGSQWDPWLLECDPSAADFRVADLSLQADVAPGRFAARRDLLAAADGTDSPPASEPTVEQYANGAREAFDLLAGERVRAAFDLGREPPPLRDRYGRHQFGQGCLLARRLVEAGVPLVQVNWHREAADDTPMWDFHWRLEENVRQKMPPMDEGYTALLEDLAARGLLEETLVVWMGEFGRTPKMEQISLHPEPGRNHWGNVFSAALAGAGVRAGCVLGASDKDGGYPQDYPVGPADLTATLFHLLGIDPTQEIVDRQGRPHALSRGRVLEEAM